MTIAEKFQNIVSNLPATGLDEARTFCLSLKMDRIDLKILRELETDGRLSFGELAQRVGLSKSPCWNRVQQLERSGVIRGYRADIECHRVGLGITALVQVMIDFARRHDFESAVRLNAEIIECHSTAGTADYILMVACHDISDLDDLLRNRISLLPGVQRSTTTVCLSVIKDRGSIAALAQAGTRYDGLAP